MRDGRRLLMALPRWAGARVILPVLLIAMQPASPPAQAASGSDRQTIDQQFAEALTLFNSPQHDKAAEAFESLIDSLYPRWSTLSNGARLILVRSLAHHAELMINIDRLDRARSDLFRLLAVNPGYEPEPTLSEDFSTLLTDVKKRNAEAARHVRSPQVGPTPPVTFPAPPSPVASTRRSSVSRTRGPFTPPRVLLLRGSALYQMSMDPLSGTSLFHVYGKPAPFTASYALGTKGAPEGYELGATIRIWKHLSVGATRTHVSFPQIASVEADIPHRDFSFSRGTERDVSGLTRSEEAWHGELGASFGDDDFELVAFIGPSWLKTTQEVVTRFAILEEDFGPSIVGADSSDLSGASKIGFNFGIDASWMFVPYMGIGVAGRYVRSDVEFEHSAGGVKRMITGGGQVSFGLRLRF